MPLGLGPRFVGEAAFLIAVAVAAALLSLTKPAIVGVMAGAWLLVAVVEWGLSRRAGAREPAREAEPFTPPIRERARPVERMLEPDLLAEPIPPERVTATGEPESLEARVEEVPPPLPEPVPPTAEPPALVAVPGPEPEPEPGPEPEPARAEVVRLDATWGYEPREWNLWELERAARDAAGDDPERDEERSFLLMYLRDFAGPDGSLPTRFDALVRDSFGGLLGSGAR